MSTESRKSVRFYPEGKEIAIISLQEIDFEKYDIQKLQFKGDFCALIDDEAHKGCSLIILSHNERENSIQNGTKVVVKIGEVLPLRGEVIWKKSLDEKVFKIGVKFLD